MAVKRTILLSLMLGLAACGRSETPEAPPGTVERVTAQQDRNDAAERRETVTRIENEADVRTKRFERRIEAIEREQTAD